MHVASKFQESIRDEKITQPDLKNIGFRSNRIGLLTQPDRVHFSQPDWIMIGSGETRYDPKIRSD